MNFFFVGLLCTQAREVWASQNVEKYCPEVVQEHNNIKTVAYANLVALLIEAVKELYDIIKDGKEWRCPKQKRSYWN